MASATTAPVDMVSRPSSSQARLNAATAAMSARPQLVPHRPSVSNSGPSQVCSPNRCAPAGRRAGTGCRRAAWCGPSAAVAELMRPAPSNCPLRQLRVGRAPAVSTRRRRGRACPPRRSRRCRRSGRARSAGASTSAENAGVADAHGARAADHHRLEVLAAHHGAGAAATGLVYWSVERQANGTSSRRRGPWRAPCGTGPSARARAAPGPPSPDPRSGPRPEELDTVVLDEHEDGFGARR